MPIAESRPGSPFWQAHAMCAPLLICVCVDAFQEFARLLLSLPGYTILLRGPGTLQNLTKRYHRLMLQVHPDKVGEAAATDKLRACVTYLVAEYDTLRARFA